MKKLVLFGNTNFAKLIKYYLENDGDRKVDFITVNEKYIEDDIFDGLPIIPFEEFLKYYDNSLYEVLICVGYSKMNTIRKRIFDSLKNNGFSIASYIHSTAVIAKDAIIGEGNIILENVVVQPFCKIGDSNLIWHGTCIAHNCEVGNYNTIASNSSVNGFVKIDNNTFVGSNSTIKDHVNICDFTLVGAGTFLSESTNKYDVYVPQKSIKLNSKSVDINL